MDFSPLIDHRLLAGVRRTVDLRNAAEVWRGLRRRARRLRLATPCYESVRRLVLAERARRARIVTSIVTLLALCACGVPVRPEQAPVFSRRNLIRVMAGIAGEIPRLSPSVAAARPRRRRS